MGRTSSHRIDQPSYRRSLPPRPKDAYKQRLDTGRWVGYLKGESGTESWCACWRDERGIERQQVVATVADVPAFSDARQLVEQEITCQRKGGGADRNYTVRQTCEDYIKEQESVSGAEAAKNALDTLKPFVLSHPIANIKLRELRHRDVKQWRDDMATYETPAQIIRKKAATARLAEWEARDKATKMPAPYAAPRREMNTRNRTLRIFKAALNFAKASKVIGSNEAWVDVKSHKVKDGHRDIYLDLDQRRWLLENCLIDLRDFLTAMLHTGARPGEVADLLVQDFDSRTGTLRFFSAKGTGDERERTTYLSPAAVAFFKECARSKMPKAALLTCSAVPWEKHWWSRELNRALKRARSAGGDHEPLPAGIVAYTMRHTTISEWLAAGIDIGRVAKAVGTSVVMIEKHYQKFIRADFQDKLSRVAII